MKKKPLPAVLAAMLAVAVIFSVFAVPSFARRKLGDIDGDGFITSADARSALRASVKLDPLDDEQAMAADVDGDTFVTSADARLILRASVKLETLPERFVGEEETTAAPVKPTEPETTTEPEKPTEPETTTEPEKPTEPETTTEPEKPTEPETTTEPEKPTEPETTTEPEKPTEPETTTEPEKPTEPETTTEPEKPTEPETTTEPEKPTEPVTQEDPDRPGFILPAKDNEFDILRSGTYYFTGKTVDESGKSDLEIAKTDHSIYLGTKFGKTNIAVLTIGNKVYLVNPANDTYLDLNSPGIRLEMKLLGIDVDSFATTNTFDFSFFPPLENATRSETVPEDADYVKYVFEAKDGAINVTMCGKTLISLESARDGSVYRIDFTRVTGEVPAKKCDQGKLKAVSQTAFVAALL